MVIRAQERGSSSKVLPVLAVVAAAAAVAFVAPAAAHGGTFRWPSSGTATLGPNTSNGGPCWNGLGEVCSGWNYWASDTMNKSSGGTLCMGFQNSTTWHCNNFSGSVFISVTPSLVGMGGYLVASDTYVSGASSVLYFSATT